MNKPFFRMSGGCSSVATSLPNIMYVPMENADGICEMVLTELSLKENPYSALSFSDFSLSNLIKNGIKPTHLAIKVDGRLGLDEEVEKFNSHLEEIASDLFNVELEK